MQSSTQARFHRNPRAFGALASAALALLGLAFAAPASADPPKTIGQNWRSQSNCAWDFPGANTYMGMVATSIDRYKDIPSSVREKLRSRIDKHTYDDFVVITRDRIVGRHSYEPVINQMQFGSKLVCGQVTRTRWNEGHIERALVYCESNICVMVPTNGRNVSRVKRGPAVVAEVPQSEKSTEGTVASNTPSENEPDLLDGLPPTAAGPAAAGGGGAGGGGAVAPFTPTFAQVATPTFTPVPALSPYSGTAGAAQTSNSGSGGIGGGGSTGGGGNGGGTTTPVPEPDAYLLLLVGGLLLGYKTHRIARAKR